MTIITYLYKKFVIKLSHSCKKIVKIFTFFTAHAGRRSTERAAILPKHPAMCRGIRCIQYIITYIYKFFGKNCYKHLTKEYAFDTMCIACFWMGVFFVAIFDVYLLRNTASCLQLCAKKHCVLNQFLYGPPLRF